jgi:hypothetical protein
VIVVRQAFTTAALAFTTAKARTCPTCESSRYIPNLPWSVSPMCASAHMNSRGMPGHLDKHDIKVARALSNMRARLAHKGRRRSPGSNQQIRRQSFPCGSSNSGSASVASADSPHLTRRNDPCFAVRWACKRGQAPRSRGHRFGRNGAQNTAMQAKSSSRQHCSFYDVPLARVARITASWRCSAGAAFRDARRQCRSLWDSYNLAGAPLSNSYAIGDR